MMLLASASHKISRALHTRRADSALAATPELDRTRAREGVQRVHGEATSSKSYTARTCDRHEDMSHRLMIKGAARHSAHLGSLGLAF